MEKRDQGEELSHALTLKPDQPVTKEAVLQKQTIAATGAAAPEKCECPPGCVGLPCCS